VNAKVQITFDARDPARLARFWAEALGYVRQPLPPGFDTWQQFAERIGLPPDNWDAYDALVDPDGAGSRLFFQRVPEDKIAKNRVHRRHRRCRGTGLGAAPVRGPRALDAARRGRGHGATEPAGRRRRDLSLRVVA